MNIQDKMQEIHHKYGVTEMANYKIQLFVDELIKSEKEQLRLHIVSQQRELLEAFVKQIKEDNEFVDDITFQDINKFIASNCG